MKKLLIAIPLLLSSFTLFVYSQTWTPDTAAIAKLESSIKPGAIPRWGNGHSPVITDYARYYTGATMNGESVILGEFVAPSGSAYKGVYVVHSEVQFPMILDGGCGIVHVVYSVKAQKLVSVGCNGVA
jgi:hypothetical protein